MQPKLWLKQTKSVIGQNAETRLRMKGLGLRGPGSEVLVDNTPSFRGAIKRVMHLVQVEETAASNVAEARKAPASSSSKKEK